MLKETLLKFLKLDGLIESISGYVETRLEIVKLELKEDLAHGIAGIAILLVVALLLFLFILFISIAVAFVLAKSMGTHIAFAVVGGFYLLLMAVMLIFRKPITEKIENEIKESINRKKNESADR